MLKKTVSIFALLSIAILSGCSYLKGQPQLEILSKRTFRTTIETGGCNAITGEGCDLTPGADIDSPKTTDYVVKSIIGVRNKGGEGKIRTEVILKTAEGQFYEKQVIYIKKGEDRTLEFVFKDVSVMGEIEDTVRTGKIPAAITYEFRSEPVSDDTPLTSDKKSDGLDFGN
jgi:hypothetical protein